MPDPGNLINLQRTLELHSEEKRRIQAELEEMERRVERSLAAIRMSEQMIKRTEEELARAIGRVR